MPNDIGKTLKEHRISAKMSVKAISDLLTNRGYKASESTIYSWENGNSQPTPGALLTMCTAYNIDNVLSVFGYNGYREDGTLQLNLNETNLVEKYRNLDNHGRESVNITLEREAERIKTITNQATALAVKSARIAELEAAQAPTNEQAATIIELYPYRGSTFCTPYFRGGISAGSGIFVLGNEAVDELEIPDILEYKDTDYAVDVNGRSMEPDYMDGDIVLVSQGEEMHPGDVGVFIIDGSAYIKEMGHTELISRNKDFPNIPILESNNVVCMGKVIGKLERRAK